MGIRPVLTFFNVAFRRLPEGRDAVEVIAEVARRRINRAAPTKVVVPGIGRRPAEISRWSSRSGCWARGRPRRRSDGRREGWCSGLRRHRWCRCRRNRRRQRNGGLRSDRGDDSSRTRRLRGSARRSPHQGGDPEDKQWTPSGSAHALPPLPDRTAGQGSDGKAAVGCAIGQPRIGPPTYEERQADISRAWVSAAPASIP
jgi:hypothetical protein